MFVIAISRQLQGWIIAAAYAAVVSFAAVAYFARHLQELRYPAESSGGMWAAGDMMLDIFVFGLFMVPTFFLLRYMAQSETAFASYSKLLLAAILTAPLCAGLLLVPRLPLQVRALCLDRLFYSPGVLIVLAMSRITGRQLRTKRLISSALVIEVLTLVAAIATFIATAKVHQ